MNTRIPTFLRVATLALSLAIPAASVALAAEQEAKAPAAGDTRAQPQQRNGAGLIVDSVYGIPVPGQSLS